jgi:hypothetical protein
MKENFSDLLRIFISVNVGKNMLPFGNIKQIKFITLLYDVAPFPGIMEAHLSQKYIYLL